MKLSELKPGNRFKNELGEFIVLGHDGDHTKVIMSGLYEESVRFGNTCNYMDSSLKRMFDEAITPEFEKVFGDALIEHEVDLVSVDMQQYGRFKCKVRPITFDEARGFNELLVNKNLPDWYWTCTPWSTKERGWDYSVAVVSPSGGFSHDDCDDCCGARPFCILKSDIFVSLED